MKRLSISLPAHIAVWMREKAERENRTLSSIVAEALVLDGGTTEWTYPNLGTLSIGERGFMDPRPRDELDVR